MPEELGFEELGGKSPAMNRHQRMGGAGAAGADRPAENALADAAFTADQDRGLAGRDCEGHFEGLPHLWLARLQLSLGQERGGRPVQLGDWRRGLRAAAGFDTRCPSASSEASSIVTVFMVAGNAPRGWN